MLKIVSNNFTCNDPHTSPKCHTLFTVLLLFLVYFCSPLSLFNSLAHLHTMILIVPMSATHASLLFCILSGFSRRTRFGFTGVGYVSLTLRLNTTAYTPVTFVTAPATSPATTTSSSTSGVSYVTLTLSHLR